MSLRISEDTHEPSLLDTSIHLSCVCEKTLTSLYINEDTHAPSFIDTSIHVSCVCEKKRLWRAYALGNTHMILRVSTLQYMYLV